MSSISTVSVSSEWEKIQNHPHENLRALSKKVDEKILKLANQELIDQTFKEKNVPDNAYLILHDLKGRLPLEIGKFTCLTNLILDDNRLENLPSTIKKLSNLKTIYLSRNRFSEFPKVLHKIRELRTIKIYNNRITSLGPDEVFSDKQILDEGNPLFFKYNELFNTYRWYALKPVKLSSASGVKNAYVNCSNYSCATSFAALCQAIHKGETSQCQAIFQSISPKIQEQILSHIPKDEKDNLFTRLDLLVCALLKTVKENRDSFDEEEQKLMRRHHLALLGIEDRSSVPNTKANVLCLIDAIILTADSESFPEENACKRRKLD